MLYFIMPFQRAYSKLLGKQKQIVFRHSELELWPSKDASLIMHVCIFDVVLHVCRLLRFCAQ